MASESMTPPSDRQEDEQNNNQDDRQSAAASPSQVTQQAESTTPQHPDFSFLHWGRTGVVRVLYRIWTRIAVTLFPENSVGERLAQALRIPLPDRLNLSWVNSHLAVGGRVRPADIKALSALGFTQVVDTRSEYCDDEQALKEHGIELLYLPTPDTYPLSIEQLLQGAAWVHERIQQGGRVLIHCEHGVGRSVLLTCAALVYGDMSAREALKLVQHKRWQAAPNHRQVARLREFEKAFLEQRKA